MITNALKTVCAMAATAAGAAIADTAPAARASEPATLHPEAADTPVVISNGANSALLSITNVKLSKATSATNDGNSIPGLVQDLE